MHAQSSWLTIWALNLFALRYTLALSLSLPHPEISSTNSYWYEWGLYGVSPRLYYRSFGASSPWLNIIQYDDRCDDGYIFIEPRGLAVKTPGPVILDSRGNLVWTETRWGQAMDVKVQAYRGKPYITFWVGKDNGTFGEGHYFMLDSAYNLFKTVSPAGNLSGDLHEFLITDEGTALVTIYEKMRCDLSEYGINNGWIFDSLFQEIDIETGELLFQWRASDHFEISDSLAPIQNFGSKEEHAFDFFHINGLSRDGNKNYIISSRYLCAVICINRVTGDIEWQLGGHGNSFTDVSDGAATNFRWQHHVTWYEGDILTIFDNGAYDRRETAERSRGILVQLDQRDKTARLLQEYVAPHDMLSGSQGSVQKLDKTILVGWGHIPAYTEFTNEGDILCDVHICPVFFHNLGLCKNYRAFKYRWTGMPKTAPTAVMRPQEETLYVSWNGATEVAEWVLQTGQSSNGDFHNIGSARKESFETRLRVPGGSMGFLRVAALDGSGRTLSVSQSVSVHETTVVEPLKAPWHENLSDRIRPIFLGVVSAAFAFFACIHFTRRIWRNDQCHLFGIIRRANQKYEMLPIRETTH